MYEFDASVNGALVIKGGQLVTSWFLLFFLTLDDSWIYCGFCLHCASSDHDNFLLCHSPFSNVVPRLPDFSLDVERIVEVVEHEKPKCIFLTSPNNPDGRYICHP